MRNVLLLILLLSSFLSSFLLLPTIEGDSNTGIGAIDLTSHPPKFLVEKAEVHDQNAEELRLILESDKAYTKSIIEAISSMGGEVEEIYENLIQVRVKPRILENLSNNPLILSMRKPVTPILDDFTSEGVEFIKADLVHSKGFLGEGIKVAVIDVGFDPSNPEIADNVKETKSFRVDGDISGGDEEAKAHGTACAEIVVDVAPKAQLYLINFETDLEFLKAVDYAISKDVKVITTSIGFINVGPYDGTSYISEAADKAAQSGILFIASAGNAAHFHWKGNFLDDDGDGFHNFSPTDETNDITLEKGETVKLFLSWDDWPTSNQDYDLYLYDEALNLVASSTNPQTGVQPPTESINFHAPVSGVYRIVIDKSNASGTESFHLFCFSKELEHYVEEGSITSPADAKGALAVGAVSLLDGTIEDYSSRGPTDDNRIKPDLTAPDGVSTSSYGKLAFYGTSASAPHVAGAAALLLSANRSMTLDKLRESLESTAIDKGAPGKDNLYGMGIIDTYTALQKISNIIQKSSVYVHAHPDEYQYPDEPPQELSVDISISYVYDGIASSLSASTPIQFQADLGSRAYLTIESTPPGYLWHEWDNYGLGRTSSTTLELTLNEDRIAIAYFTKTNASLGNNTILEVHAHPLDIRYPNEPPEELPLKIRVTYTFNRTSHENETFTVGPDPLTITLDANSTATLSAIKVPGGFTWNGWEIFGVRREDAVNETVQVTVKGNSSIIAVAYLKPITAEKMGFTLTVKPERLVFIPGQTANFTIHITPVNGFEGEVSLEVEAPPEVEAEITPRKVHPPGTAILTVTIGRQAETPMEIIIKAVFQNTTVDTKIILQAWSVPGFHPLSMALGILAALIIVIRRRLIP